MLWRRHRWPNVSGRRKLTVVIHGLVSGLFLPFLVVYFVETNLLSLALVGTSLLLGFLAARLGAVGVRAKRHAGLAYADRGYRVPPLAVRDTLTSQSSATHRDACALPDHIDGPEVGDLDGGHRAVRDSTNPTGPALTVTAAQ